MENDDINQDPKKLPSEDHLRQREQSTSEPHDDGRERGGSEEGISEGLELKPVESTM